MPVAASRSEPAAAMLLLPASVTLADAADTQRLLTQAMRREIDAAAAGVVVDATHLRHFDSSALAVLLECQRLAASQGRGFRVRGAPAKLVALADLYGIDGVLPLAAAD